MDRLYAMVGSGEFWEDTLSDMIEIGQRLHKANEDGILQKSDLKLSEIYLLNNLVEA